MVTLFEVVIIRGELISMWGVR